MRLDDVLQYFQWQMIYFLMQLSTANDDWCAYRWILAVQLVDKCMNCVAYWQQGAFGCCFLLVLNVLQRHVLVGIYPAGTLWTWPSIGPRLYTLPVTDICQASPHYLCYSCCAGKQGVVLTGRNTTGPPCSVGRPRARWPARPPAGIVTDDDRRQRAKQHLPIRRASNKSVWHCVSVHVECGVKPYSITWKVNFSRQEAAAILGLHGKSE